MKLIKTAAAILCVLALLIYPSSAKAADTVTVCVIIDDAAIKGASEGTSILDGFIYELEKANIKVTFFIDSENTTFSTDFIFAVMSLRVGGFPCGIKAENKETILEWMSSIKIASGEMSALVMAVSFHDTALVVCQPDFTLLERSDFDFIASQPPSGAMIAFSLTAERTQLFFETVEALNTDSGINIAYLTRYGETRVPQ